MHSYVGRFAPSPTGALHFGSLVAAVGSYLQARCNGGAWLLRIEDLDPPRTVPGAADAIQRDLERLGFEWDGPIVRQSAREQHYREALSVLTAKAMTYECCCSRKDTLAAAGEVTSRYPGTCRTGLRVADVPTALRVRTTPDVIEIADRLQGRFAQRLENDAGDFVVRRRDGLHAYQLAVVVDDHLQGVTEVVRGSDLLDSTPRQWYLQDLLAIPHPNYVHLPVALGTDGRKLSKQKGAPDIAREAPSRALCAALEFLQQGPPAQLRVEPTTEPIWAWAVKNWRLEALQGVRALAWEKVQFAWGSNGN
jgi:glutamyl-Q tRNA(Asp) synthetase